jgi:hypothetical protein
MANGHKIKKKKKKKKKSIKIIYKMHTTAKRTSDLANFVRLFPFSFIPVRFCSVGISGGRVRIRITSQAESMVKFRNANRHKAMGLRSGSEI